MQGTHSDVRYRAYRTFGTCIPENRYHHEDAVSSNLGANKIYFILCQPVGNSRQAFPPQADLGARERRVGKQTDLG